MIGGVIKQVYGYTPDLLPMASEPTTAEVHRVFNALPDVGGEQGFGISAVLLGFEMGSSNPSELGLMA